jgi:hypothetical protein
MYDIARFYNGRNRVFKVLRKIVKLSKIKIITRILSNIFDYGHNTALRKEYKSVNNDTCSIIGNEYHGPTVVTVVLKTRLVPSAINK